MLFSSEELLELKRTAPQYGRTQGLADKLDDLQKGRIDVANYGTMKVYQPIVISYEVTTGAASIIVSANLPFKIRVIDVVIEPMGASTNGTIEIHDGTYAITNTMLCATDKTIARATTIDDAYSTIAAGGTLEIVCAGDAVGSTVALVTIKAIAVD